MFNRENQSDVMKEIVETTTKLGISLSDGAMKALEESCIKVAEYIRVIKDKVDSGISEQEAIEWYFDQMTEDEQSKFMADLELVGKYETAKLLHEIDK